MAAENILEKFQNGGINVNEYSGVCVFNCGKSAFFIKKYKLYEYGEGNRCFIGGKTRYVPTEVFDLKYIAIKRISVDLFHGALIDERQRVFCWGDNRCGQLGIGLKSEGYIAPTQIRLPKIKQISCGPWYTLALSIFNKLYIWGELCNTIQSNKPINVYLSSEIIVHSISTGCWHAAILDSTGNVYTWGCNTSGQLGQNRNIKCIYEPTRIDFSKKVRNILAGKYMTVVLTIDGKLYATGLQENRCGLMEICGFNNSITEIAGSWCHDLLAIKDSFGQVYELKRDNNNSTSDTIKTTIYKQLWELIADTSSHPTISTCNTNISHRNQMTTNEIEQEATFLNISEHSDCFKTSNLYNNKLFSDIKIKLSEEYIYGHKIILYNKSEYFKKLIDNSLSEDMLDISNCNAKPYKCFIKYLYTGNLEIQSLEDIPEIFTLAVQDYSDKLKFVCMSKWRNGLTEYNIVHYYQIAYNFKIQMLLDSCAQLLYNHLPTIVSTDEYNNLPEPIKTSLVLAGVKYNRDNNS